MPEDKKDKRDWIVTNVTLSSNAKRHGLGVIYPYHVDVSIDGEYNGWCVPSITDEHTRWNLDNTLVAH